jgi:hypothetical protein
MNFGINSSNKEFKQISVNLDLAIDRGLFDDLYGANSSVNAPELFCDSVRDEAIGSCVDLLLR